MKTAKIRAVFFFPHFLIYVMWIVRDKNGDLLCYITRKPRRDNKYKCWGWKGCVESVSIKNELFKEITYESKPKWVRFIRPEWIDTEDYEPKTSVDNILKTVKILMNNY